VTVIDSVIQPDAFVPVASNVGALVYFASSNRVENYCKTRKAPSTPNHAV